VYHPGARGAGFAPPAALTGAEPRRRRPPFTFGAAGWILTMQSLYGSVGRFF
jgi:hypothetical protein